MMRITDVVQSAAIGKTYRPERDLTSLAEPEAHAGFDAQNEMDRTVYYFHVKMGTKLAPMKGTPPEVVAKYAAEQLKDYLYGDIRARLAPLVGKSRYGRDVSEELAEILNLIEGL